MPDDEARAIFRRLAKQRRGYAAFFEFPDKAIKEKIVAEQLIEQLEQEAGSPIKKLVERSEGQDPPDLEVHFGGGKIYALEVTEIVDQKKIEEIRRRSSPESDFRVYTKRDFEESIRSRLQQKDSKILKGGPYDKYIVVLHTDEFSLDREQVANFTARMHSIPVKQIDAAYVLLSYNPAVGSYPVFRLWLNRQSLDGSG